MPEFINHLKVFSPAKINLHLAVKDRRPDGFHDLESVFLALDWGDELFFTWNESESEQYSEDAFSMTWFGAGGGKNFIHDNIILKVFTLFREKTGLNMNFKVKVKKRIPIGGGLGGGSSNAAATLLFLNHATGFPLDRDELFIMGASLGSDVPFFLHETAAAWVTGRGEFIEPMEIPRQFIVLVNPGFPSSTKEAFHLLDEYRKLGIRNEELQIKPHFLNPSFLTSHSSFYNDFLPVFPEKEKAVYSSIISELKELGADFASLSGSGSTCFGIFKEEEQAQMAAKVLCKKWMFAEFCRSKGFK